MTSKKFKFGDKVLWVKFRYKDGKLCKGFPKRAVIVNEYGKTIEDGYVIATEEQGHYEGIWKDELRRGWKLNRKFKP